ncbi:MAG: DUF1189 domain-containing protein [Clostridiales bacterium]|nr:DUF1189 domain-containing protein [Clostridiales bacterium]
MSVKDFLKTSLFGINSYRRMSSVKPSAVWVSLIIVIVASFVMTYIPSYVRIRGISREVDSILESLPEFNIKNNVFSMPKEDRVIFGKGKARIIFDDVSSPGNMVLSEDVSLAIAVTQHSICVIDKEKHIEYKYADIAATFGTSLDTVTRDEIIRVVGFGALARVFLSMSLPMLAVTVCIRVFFCLIATLIVSAMLRVWGVRGDFTLTWRISVGASLWAMLIRGALCIIGMLIGIPYIIKALVYWLTVSVICAFAARGIKSSLLLDNNVGNGSTEVM